MSKAHKINKTITAYDLLPKDIKSQKILRSRANSLAMKPTSQDNQVKKNNYIRFKLSANEYYGIPYEYSMQVLHNVLVTPLPFVPDYIAGVINHHGQLIAVINLNHLFHAKKIEYSSVITVIIVAHKGMKMGILANAIEGSDGYNVNELEKSFPIQDQIKSEYILGLHKNKVAILDANAILSDVKAQLETLATMKNF